MPLKETPRKVIQVAALRMQTAGADGPAGDARTEVVALCDDGSIWTIIDTINGEWVPLPKIPQWQLFEDWRTDVAACLVSDHLMPTDAAEQILGKHRAELLSGHDAGQPAGEVAATIAALYK